MHGNSGKLYKILCKVLSRLFKAVFNSQGGHEENFPAFFSSKSCILPSCEDDDEGQDQKATDALMPQMPPSSSCSETTTHTFKKYHILSSYKH